MTTTRIVFSSNPENVMEVNTLPSTAPRKRQRLTHMTPEEKMLRRKLKNRVAAQTARDRKKAHMDTIEETLDSTQMINHKLLKENRTLKHHNAVLMSENLELRNRLGLPAIVKIEPCTPALPADGMMIVKKSVESPESAAGADSTGFGMVDHPFLLESDMLLGFLEDLDSEVSPDQGDQFPGKCSSNRRSPGEGGSYPVVGPTAEELESLKELIRFDHEYVKKAPSMNIKQEKTDVEQSSDFIEIDMEDSVIDLDLDVEPMMSFAPRVKADPEFSTECPSLLTDARDTMVPSILSMDDSVFDCDFTQLLSVDSDICDSKSDAGLSENGSSVDSAFSDTPGSPFSEADITSNLGDNIWEESFTDLFPSLDFL